ncbi:MAG: hypothetical protein QOE31_2621 [Solirubrobacteraceae bacterium]|nr:hypothetical protein [Solirubrobacteraceae bacterium]
MALPFEAVDALRRSPTLVERSLDSVIAMTLDGVITGWNPAAERLYGYSAEEALGASISMLVPHELRGTTHLLARIAAGETLSQVDTHRVAKDGSRRDVLIAMAPVRDEQGVIIGATAFTRDVNSAERIEERLREQQAQIAEALEAAALGSWEWDVISGDTTWSAGVSRILGVDHETFIQSFDRYFEHVHPEDRSGLQAHVRAVLEDTSTVFDEVYRVVRPDGVERIVASRARAMVDAAGAAIRLVGTSQDVTESVRARRQLDLVSLHNEALLNSAADGIYGLNVDGTVTFANPAALRLTGHAIDDMSGCRLHDTIQPTRSDGSPYPAHDSPMLASLCDGTVHRCEVDVFWRKDGTSFPVEYTCTPLREHGATTGAVVIFKDISERREVERLKDQFTSVVSHELRTPLTSIRASLGLLASGALGALPEQGRRMLEIAVQNTDRLGRLVNDILDIERIGSGTIEMSPKRCDAVQLVERAVESVAAIADETGVRIEIEAEPAEIDADAERILQTLTNLISNAVKFSPPGAAVRVVVQRRDDDVLFRVSDCGRGIPADKLESIFERFHQVDASDSREKGGTGLGLAICRAIVDLHGGRIWAHSTPGHGATLSFALPAVSAADRAAAVWPS